MPSVPQPPPAPRSSPMINMNILLYIFAHIFAVHSAVHICFLFVFHFIILKIFYISISFLWFFKEKKTFLLGFWSKLVEYYIHTLILCWIQTIEYYIYLSINFISKWYTPFLLKPYIIWKYISFWKYFYFYIFFMIFHW